MVRFFIKKKVITCKEAGEIGTDAALLNILVSKGVFTKKDALYLINNYSIIFRRVGDVLGGNGYSLEDFKRDYGGRCPRILKFLERVCEVG